MAPNPQTQVEIERLFFTLAWTFWLLFCAVCWTVVLVCVLAREWSWPFWLWLVCAITSLWLRRRLEDWGRVLKEKIDNKDEGPD